MGREGGVQRLEQFAGDVIADVQQAVLRDGGRRAKGKGQRGGAEGGKGHRVISLWIGGVFCAEVDRAGAVAAPRGSGNSAPASGRRCTLPPRLSALASGARRGRSAGISAPLSSVSTSRNCAPVLAIERTCHGPAKSGTGVRSAGRTNSRAGPSGSGLRVSRELSSPAAVARPACKVTGSSMVAPMNRATKGEAG